MAKQKQQDKAFRALVGVYGNGSTSEAGTFLLDSNDTSKFYAFFALMTGMTPQAEAHCRNFFSKNVEPYADSMRQDVFGKPASFLKTMLEALVKELHHERLMDSEDGEYSIMAAIVKNASMHIGRVNGMPMFVLKDRKLKKVFKDSSVKGLQSVQVVSTQIGHDDMLLASTPEIMKHLTDLELRRIMLLESDLNLVCSRVNMQANKYEETANSRIVAVRLKRKKPDNRQVTATRTTAVMAALFAMALVFLLWGEIARYASNITVKGIFGKNKSIQNVLNKVSMPKMKSFKVELVYEDLAVPYDIAVDKDGILYILDDKEEQIIRYDIAEGKRTLVGEDVKLVFPTGIEVMGDMVFVADFSRHVNRVFVFRKDGTYMGRIPDDDSGRVAMRNPKAMAVVEKEMALYVCDRGNNRILKFRSDGKLEGNIELPSGYKEPNGIAVTQNGTLYISMKMSGQIGKIASQNHITEFELFKDAQGGTEKVSLAKPSGIAVDLKGNIYIADTSNQRVLVVDDTGRLMGEIDREKIKELNDYYPMSVKIDPEGEYLYIVAGNRYSYDITCSDQCNGKIWRIKI